MSDLDDVLEEILDRQVKAEEKLHNGDPEPRLAMWSTRDPVTLFGAAMSKRGAEEVRAFFRVLASSFSDCTAYRFELVAAGASGDLAYTVGYEHTSVSIDGVPVQYVLRVTHVYRREDGEWKIVHRHGDNPPVEQGRSPTPSVGSRRGASRIGSPEHANARPRGAHAAMQVAGRGAGGGRAVVGGAAGGRGVDLDHGGR